MPNSKHPTDDVLRYSLNPRSRSVVRRHYARWREEQGITRRCEIADCSFQTEPLVWRGIPLPLILDHINGNNRDNSPANLRYICPNCDSQLATRGGANRGRVQEAKEGMYILGSKDGRRHMHIIPEPARLAVTGYTPEVRVGPAPRDAA